MIQYERDTKFDKLPPGVIDDWDSGTDSYSIVLDTENVLNNPLSMGIKTTPDDKQRCYQRYKGFVRQPYRITLDVLKYSKFKDSNV